MQDFISPIISVAELKEVLKQDFNLLLFDVSNGKEAFSNYKKKHLENAVFVDLNTQLASIHSDLSVGGRHPLPDIKKFSKVLGGLGITPKSHIVLYDAMSGANASARFWWMLKAVGHKKVQVLDGGFEIAEKEGFPTNDKLVENSPVIDYPVSEWLLPLITMDEIDAIKANNDFLMIDVREEKRYSGITEPIDLVAGHIPGAVNIPFSRNLDKNGLFLSKEALREMYSKYLNKYKAENIVIHCGSGVTACHSILALYYIGFEFPKLYVGSWSEWSRNDKEMVLKA